MSPAGQRQIRVGHLLAAPGVRPAQSGAIIHVDGDRIVGVDETDRLGAEASLLAMPPLVNAHDHARGLRPSTLGALDLPFELWGSAVGGAPAADPYLVAAVALGRAALGGVGAVMVHYTRPQGGRDPVDEASDVCRAAADVGVRIAFAVAQRDRQDIAYCDNEAALALLDEMDRERIRKRLVRPPLGARESVALVEKIAARCSSDRVDVQFGPVGVQWCSQELLAAIADASARTGRRVHMHLLETRVQREWADSAYPQGIVRYLDELGLLSPRLCVAHAVWARPDEVRLMADRGVSVCINASSNLHLGSGVAPAAEFARAGLRFALGIDGLSMDDDDDALRELRLNHMLHKGVSFDAGVPLATMVHAATETGRRVVTGDPGPATIAAGRPADILLLRYAELTRDVIAENVDPLALIVARASRAHIDRLIVAGRDVVSGGRLTGLDLAGTEAELARQVSEGAADFREWQRTAKKLRSHLTRFYTQGMHRCH